MMAAPNGRTRAEHARQLAYDHALRAGATPQDAWLRGERAADDSYDRITRRVDEAAERIWPAWRSLVTLHNALKWDHPAAPTHADPDAAWLEEWDRPQRAPAGIDRAKATLDAELRVLVTAERAADRDRAKGALDAVVRDALADERSLRVLDDALDRVGAQRVCR